MPVNEPAAYGVYPRDVALPDVIHILNRAGFGNEEICMVLPPAHPAAAVVRNTNMFGAEREASVSSASMIGLFSEMGAVVIPTIGFFIRSQAYFRALVTEQDSSPCGGSRTLKGLGFSEDDADRLDEELSQGALVYVSCQEGYRTDWAIELLRCTGATEAATLKKAQGAGAAA